MTNLSDPGDRPEQSSTVNHHKAHLLQTSLLNKIIFSLSTYVHREDLIITSHVLVQAKPIFLWDHLVNNNGDTVPLTNAIYQFRNKVQFYRVCFRDTELISYFPLGIFTQFCNMSETVRSSFL